MEHKPSYSDFLQADIQPSYTDSLMHHGIKGMKWGVRRFQNEDGSLTRAGRERYNSGSNTAKNIANGIGTAAAIGAVGVGAYAIAKRSGMLAGSAQYISKKSVIGLPRQLARDSDMLDAAMKVNPKANSGDQKYLLNCVNCSMAYDLRRKGYDVEAGPAFTHLESFTRKAWPNAEHYDIPGMSIDGTGTAKNRDLSFTNIRKNIKMLKSAQKKMMNDPDGFYEDQVKMTNSILDKVESMGPGARGSITLSLTNGMGHCIAFECDKTGQAHIIDSQLIGTDTASWMNGAHGGRGSDYIENFIKENILPYGAATINRYDNTEPDYEFLIKKKAIVPSNSSK